MKFNAWFQNLFVVRLNGVIEVSLWKTYFAGIPYLNYRVFSYSWSSSARILKHLCKRFSVPHELIPKAGFEFCNFIKILNVDWDETGMISFGFHLLFTKSPKNYTEENLRNELADNVEGTSKPIIVLSLLAIKIHRIDSLKNVKHNHANQVQNKGKWMQ